MLVDDTLHFHFLMSIHLIKLGFATDVIFTCLHIFKMKSVYTKSTYKATLLICKSLYYKIKTDQFFVSD